LDDDDDDDARTHEGVRALRGGYASVEAGSRRACPIVGCGLNTQSERDDDDEQPSKN